MILLVRHNIDVVRANWMRKNRPSEFYITVALAEKAIENEQKRVNKVRDRTSPNKGVGTDPKEALRSMAERGR